MKILYITEFFPSTTAIDIHGGVEARTYYLANYIAQYHHISVITSRELGKSSSRLSKISVFRVGWLRSYFGNGQILMRLFFIGAAIWRGLAIDFDLVEGAGLISWLPAWVLGTVKRKKKTIVVADTVNAYVIGSPLVKWGIGWFEKLLLSSNWDGIICISQTVKQKLLDHGDIKNEPVVIYCGVDVTLTQKLKVIKSTFPTICCVSRLVKYKHLDDLITASINLKKQFPALRVYIVGIGEELSRLKTRVSANNLQDTIIFKGFIYSHKKILQIIKSAHIFCFPSMVEGFGIVAIEALACGVPVVLPRNQVNIEVSQSNGVLYYAPNDIPDLTNKLSLLLSNKVLYKKLQDQATIIARKYSWEIIGKQTKLFYENLCTN